MRGENPLLRKNSSNPSSRQRKDQLSPKFDGTMDSTTDSNNKTLLTNDDNLFVTIDEDDDDEENADCCTKCCQQERFLGVKLDTLMRILKVCTAFPFVIVVASLNLSNSYSFLRSITGIRVMNVIIFVAPFIYVKYVLSEFDYVAIQRIAVAMYTFLYLFPVGYVVFSKVKVSQVIDHCDCNDFY